MSVSWAAAVPGRSRAVDAESTGPGGRAASYVTVVGGMEFEGTRRGQPQCSTRSTRTACIGRKQQRVFYGRGSAMGGRQRVKGAAVLRTRPSRMPPPSEANRWDGQIRWAPRLPQMDARSGCFVADICSRSSTSPLTLSMPCSGHCNSLTPTGTSCKSAKGELNGTEGSFSQTPGGLAGTLNFVPIVGGISGGTQTLKIGQTNGICDLG